MTKTKTDHLLLGVPSLQEGIDLVSSKLGVAPVLGGKHPGVGTHNALLSLGSTTYLEVIAPDPSQQILDRDLPYGLAGLQKPRLVTWAVRPTDWNTYEGKISRLGLKTQMREGSRLSPGGIQFVWRSALPVPPVAVECHDLTGLLPFAIDWRCPQHPAESAPGTSVLDSLTLLHPHPTAISKVLEELELPCGVKYAPEAGIKATIRLESGATIALE